MGLKSYRDRRRGRGRETRPEEQHSEGSRQEDRAHLGAARGLVLSRHAGDRARREAARSVEASAHNWVLGTDTVVACKLLKDFSQQVT